ncbi:ABC transporter substrate binding protein [Paenibacillus vortex V453]|uniref:ABC transporter substrate binding protein n=1 Tax=Paenibacillus vortex V453 TaxID=715225 RepID=A0A2R9SWA0_9BACL|nr:extracellular solute-binding protein [Paenibacillus vortex]EFU41623.1 ABC transporter substrate binding protein [Paenibacillus vortex V453]
MKKGRLASIILALTLSISLLSACGGAKTASNGGAESAEGSTVSGELVFAGNGATVESLFKDEIFKKFNEKYPDVKLTYVAGVATDIVAKVKAQQGSSQIDIAFIEGSEQEAGRVEGLWEALNADEIPNMSKIDDRFRVSENSGVTINYTPMGISYNAKLIQNKNLPVPASWNDLTLPEMKNNITLTEMSSNFGRSATIMLAYANGGSEADMTQGFEQLKTIASYMPTFAKTAAQIQQNLQDETAAYTAWTMARSIVQKDAGVDLEFVIPEEGANIVPTVASIVKGAKNPEAAKAFIDFILTDEIQTLFATKLYYNPVMDVTLPDDIGSLINFDKSKIVNFDYGVISENKQAWLETFNKDIAPLVGK